MFGLKPDPEEVDRVTKKSSAQYELRLELVLLVLPGAMGLYMVVSGIPDGAYLQVVIGLILIACTPFLARRIIRNSEFGSRED